MKTRKPKQVIPADDPLSPEEKKIVRRGEAQLKRGESKRWRAIKNAATALGTAQPGTIMGNLALSRTLQRN